MATTPTPEQLRRLIRTQAGQWLADDNVTSVGIGRKVVDGRATDQVSVQFTVRAKLSPEELDALPTERLPESVTVEQAEVPTDVLERTYSPAFQVVPEAASDTRRTRVDPVMPGVSAAHPSVSAGTLGCVVRDAAEGTPLFLSNWHVLHGPAGQIGDDVLQPGPHDNNRTGRNRLGTLVRSHLGLAGDCAVCTVEGREIDPEVLEIGVVPDQIADPELGDKVVKSGRTTGVTHGVISRVDTVVKIDYGEGPGEVQVGCFEIDPDPNRDQDQLSDGGDSGAVWLHKAANGHPNSVLAGLHFAGDAGGDDHALACLPRSVFNKLGVTLDADAAIESAAQAARERGFDPDFLDGHTIDVPTSDPSDLVEVDGSTTIPYTHFSLAQSSSRRFARWVAWNIDGGALKSLSRSGQDFVFDDRLPEETQVGNDLYADNPIDRGHIARRADLCWGENAPQANSDSFHWTNIAPHMEDFNQSGRDGVWGRLENAIFEDVEVEDLRVSVLGGPVLHEDDQTYRGVQVPKEFWKVICFVADGELRARAFLLTQNLERLETLGLDEFRTWQVGLGQIAERTGLTFADALTGVAAPEGFGEPLELGSTTDIQW